MTFKLPKLPSAHAGAHELADFAEILAWKNGKTSEREVISILGRQDENAKNVGVNDDEEIATNFLEQVMIEVDRRINACRGGYPYRLTRNGTVIEYCKDSKNEVASIVYRYLLLSTRLNMKSSKVHGGIDGTTILEKLAAHVLAKYLGLRAKSHVFGTAQSGTFRAKVDDLCKKLNEGVGFRNLDGSFSVHAVDDKLDAVAWNPFSDGTPGQLIVFGQCKTGSSWAGLESQLQPSLFAKRWFIEPFLVDPIRAFCLSEAVDRSQWKKLHVSAGVIFDRCRLVDFCDGFDISETQIWTDIANDSFEVGDLATG